MSNATGYDLERVRSELPFLEDVTYLSTGTFGLMAESVLKRHLASIANRERHGHFANQQANEAYENTRSVVAAFLNASSDEIALTRNATDGVNMVVSGLRLTSHDHILTSDEEHPAVLLPLGQAERSGGAVVHTFSISTDPEVTLESFRGALTPETRLVIFSHVTSETGIRLPAEEICRICKELEILVLIDGAQSVGQFQLDVRKHNCDFMTANGHKWLCGPKGTGFLYVRREVLDLLRPAYLGSGSVVPGDGRVQLRTNPAGAGWYLQPNGRRFEYTTSNWQTFAALADAIEYLSALGWRAIENHCATVSESFKDDLIAQKGVTLHTPRSWGNSSGLVTFSLASWDGHQLSEKLWNDFQILQRPTHITNGIRISCGYFTSSEDTDRVMSAIRQLA